MWYGFLLIGSLYGLTAVLAGMFFKVDRLGTVDFKGTKVDCKSHFPFVKNISFSFEVMKSFITT